MTTDELAFRAAICADPDSDALRLVYADQLYDWGRNEQAEFVRVQVELARLPNSARCHDKPTADKQQCLDCWEDEQLRRRERELFGVIVYGNPVATNSWYWSPKCLIKLCDDAPLMSLSNPAHLSNADDSVSWNFSRGLIAHVAAPLATLIDGECPKCGGDGVNPPYNYHRESCRDCRGTGRTPGIIAALHGVEPIEPDGVRATDREPYHNGAGYCWFDAERTIPRDEVYGGANLPRELFHFVRLEKGNERNGRWAAFDSPAAAHAALGRAVMAFVRAEVMAESE